MRAELAILTSRLDPAWLAATFHRAAPPLNLYICREVAAVAAVRQQLGRPVRLVSVLAGQVVPADLLAALGVPAYNLHPGPPAYPGSCPEAFALYDGAAAYGVTAHVMTARVDAGPIVAHDPLPIPPGCDRLTLARAAHAAILSMCDRLAPALAAIRELAPNGMDWAGPARRAAEFAALCRLPAGCGDAEAARRIRCLDDGSGLVTAELGGRLFRLMPAGG